VTSEVKGHSNGSNNLFLVIHCQPFFFCTKMDLFFLELKHLMHINGHSGSRHIEKNDQTWCHTRASSAIAHYFQNFDIFPYCLKILLGSLPEISCSGVPGVLHANFHAHLQVFKAPKVAGRVGRISRNSFSKSTRGYSCVFSNFFQAKLRSTNLLILLLFNCKLCPSDHCF